MRHEQSKSRSPSRAILPEADRAYAVESEWSGERHQFEVSFSQGLVDALRTVGAEIDLHAGDVVIDGDRHDLLAARAEFQRRTGLAAPAWLFRWHGKSQPFVLPRGTLRLDFESTTGALVLTPPRVCIPVFSCLTAPSRIERAELDAEAFRACTAAEWRPLRRTVYPGLTLAAPSSGELQLAQDAFEAVCGSTASTWAERRPIATAQLDAVLELASAAVEPLGRRGGRGERLLRASRRLLGLHESVALDLDEAVLALGVAQRALESELMPVELIVVPVGKHFSALPEMQPLREQLTRPPVAMDENGAAATSATPLHSATVVVGGQRFVFLPGEDLASGQISSRHELYHLLEAQLFTDEQRERVSAFHATTVENAGPFARPYGYLRQEFLPTMGEVYEGAYGSDGLVWLRARHGAFAAFLDEVTGRPERRRSVGWRASRSGPEPTPSF